jgi:hypothetical protein
MDPTKVYAVACDHYDIRSNSVLADFATTHPDEVPHFGGSPALAVLVEYFCAELWRSILNYYGASDPTAAESEAVEGWRPGSPDRCVSRTNSSGAR